MNKEQETFLIKFIKAKQNGTPLTNDNTTEAQRVLAFEIAKIPQEEIKQFLIDNRELWKK